MKAQLIFGYAAGSLPSFWSCDCDPTWYFINLITGYGSTGT